MVVVERVHCTTLLGAIDVVGLARRAAPTTFNYSANDSVNQNKPIETSINVTVPTT